MNQMSMKKEERIESKFLTSPILNVMMKVQTGTRKKKVDSKWGGRWKDIHSVNVCIPSPHFHFLSSSSPPGIWFLAKMMMVMIFPLLPKHWIESFNWYKERWRKVMENIRCWKGRRFKRIRSQKILFLRRIQWRKCWVEERIKHTMLKLVVVFVRYGNVIPDLLLSSF